MKESSMIIDIIETQIWCLKDPETYGRVNRAHADFLGLAKSEIEAEKFDNFLSPAAARIFKQGNKKIFKTEQKVYTEEWWQNNQGERRLLAITRKAQLDHSGEIDCVVCTAEDITAQREREYIVEELHRIAVDFKELKKEREVCRMAVKAAEGLLNFALCNVILVKGDRFVPLASSSRFKQEEISVSEKSIAARTYREGKSFIIDDIQNSSETISIKNIYKSGMSIPIGSFGVFQTAASKKKAFTESDLELAEILISHVSASLGRIYAQQKLKEQKDFLSTILEVQSSLVLLINPEGEIISFNHSCEQLTGYQEAEVKGKKVCDLFIKESEKKEVINVFKQLKNNDYPASHENYWLTRKGEKKLILWSHNPILDDENNLKYVVAAGMDITERKIQEEKIKEQKAYFEQLFNNSTEAIVLLDNKHCVLKVNKKFESLFGFKQSELINKNIDDYILPEQCLKTGKKFTEKVKNGGKVEGESIRKTKSGEQINVHLQGFPIKLENGQIGIYALYRDITERKKKEKQIEYLSFHDELTGLYNRRYFENELKRLNSSRQHPITIVIGDLDGLKIINDTYGHQKGDQYIASTANILKKTARIEDIIARIGGDEFALILPQTAAEEAEGFCRRLKLNIQEFNQQQQLEKPLSISFGFDVMQDNSSDLARIFNQADQNMYLNKGRK
ncbi:sensor domain-containing diguanylate cyclase [Halanaerobium saccharolyticum]|nr:PAS domain S-box protein [Halanaerobium saccharolyticum]